jgi:hypothetical protein
MNWRTVTACLPLAGELGPVRPDRCVVVQKTSISEHVQHGRRHALGRRPRHRHGVAFPRQPTRRVAIPGPHVEHRTAVEIHAQRATTGRQRGPASECRDVFEPPIDHGSRHVVKDFTRSGSTQLIPISRRHAQIDTGRHDEPRRSPASWIRVATSSSGSSPSLTRAGYPEMSPRWRAQARPGPPARGALERRYRARPTRPAVERMVDRPERPESAPITRQERTREVQQDHERVGARSRLDHPSPTSCVGSDRPKASC